MYRVVLIDEFKFSWDVMNGHYYPVKPLLNHHKDSDCWVLSKTGVAPVLKSDYKVVGGRATFSLVPDPFSVAKSAIDDLARRGAGSPNLSDVSVSSRIEKVDEGRIRGILSEVDTADSWTPFQREFPGCAGILRLSWPGYSDGGNEAAVYIESTADPRGPEGYVRFLRQDAAGKWALTDYHYTKSSGPEKITISIDPKTPPEERKAMIEAMRGENKHIPVVVRAPPVPGRFEVEKGRSEDLRGASNVQVWADKEDLPLLESEIHRLLPDLVVLQPPAECGRIEINLSGSSSQAGG